MVNRKGVTRFFKWRRRIVEPSCLPFRDLMSESLAGITQRPARSVLTSVGTILGVGTFVAVLGITATASSQIDSRFNSLMATEVTVEDVSREKSEFADLAFPQDAGRRAEGLNGVLHAGVYWTIQLPNKDAVRAVPVEGSEEAGRIQVVAASPGALEASSPSVSEGRTFDDWHNSSGQRVAVLGSAIAARLGITTLETQPAIFLGDEPFIVVGIIDDVKREPELLLSVVVPQKAGFDIWGPPRSNAKMLVATDLGAANQVASEISLALDPAHPEYFKAVPPPDPRSLRTSVTNDLDELFLLLAGICLVIGAVGIANTTLVSVMERTGEIGLRRTLGARARHITVQFLCESSVLGTLGGLIGSSLGVVSVVVVALLRDWTPIIHPATVTSAPGVGLVTGLLAGLYPAWRASRVQPVEALRR
ncbi:ABC transporter permease [Streptomyces sp. NPDC090029]|uniref:ABC transporter permease n=1 Tax=Streptomyces sp. NPDC090029 TaxID=3365924 RepID=UPI0038289FFB